MIVEAVHPPGLPHRDPASLERYAGRILLAGITYDEKDPEKQLTCVIEEWEKGEA